MRTLLVTLLALMTLGVTPSEAQSLFSLMRKGKEVLCGPGKSGSVPFFRAADGTMIDAAARLRVVKKLIKKAKGANKKKLAREQSNLVSAIARGRSVCRLGPGQPGAQPLIVVPTPTPTPIATPIATPSTPLGCFGAGGETRLNCFGIPAPLIGNISRGETFYRANCMGCHNSVKNNRTWSQVNTALNTIPQMRPFRPSDQTLADVLAYLNRFNF